MSGIEIETRFNAAVSRLVAVLEQEDLGRVLDGTGAMQLLVEVKPRTASVITRDLEAWLTWWQERGRLAGVTLHQSVPAYLEYLVGSGLGPSTLIRYRYSIRRVLAAVGSPVEDNGEVRSIELITCHSTIENKRWTRHKAIPFGWGNIRSCIRSADPDSHRDVNALAGMLVMYEAMAWSDQIFGHFSGDVWHVAPASRNDLQRMPDGGGRLQLTPMRQGDTARPAVLSQLTMEWIERVGSFGRSPTSSLLAGPRGDALRHSTWKKWVKPLIARSGMDSRKFSSVSLRLGMVRDLHAAGFTVDAVLKEGGWATRFPILRLIHGSSSNGATHKPLPHHKWMHSSRNECQPRPVTGREAVVSQMSFPGI